jgi:YD repeat-containing protein
MGRCARFLGLSLVLGGLTLSVGAEAAFGAVRTGQPGEYAMDQHQVGADTSVGVDLFSGNLLVVQQDLVPAASTYWVAYSHSYNSLAATANNGMGPRWAFSVGPSVFLDIATSTVTAHGPNGYAQVFTEAADGSYAPPVGSSATLTKSTSGSYTLVQSPDATRLTFDSSGQLTDIVDAASRPFTVAQTSAGGHTVLSSFGTSDGRRINASYNGDARVREIDDPASTHRSYTYDAQGRLASYVSSTGTTTYGYDTNGFLNSIALPNGDAVATVNFSDGRVSSLTITLSGAAAQTYTYTYTSGNTTTVTYPDASQDINAFDSDGQLLEDPGVMAEAVADYAAATDVSETQAAADLVLQDASAPLEDPLNVGLGDFYTGMWVDPSDGRLKISVAIGAPLDYVTDQIAAQGLTSQTDIIQRQATWSDLTSAQDSIDSSLSELADAGLVELSITPENGAVQIEKTNALSSAQEAQISAAVASATVPVTVHESDVAAFNSSGTGANDCNLNALCGYPLRGGIHIQPNGVLTYDTAGSCTAGFMARRNTDSKLFMVTAGHCLAEFGPVGGALYTSAPGDTYTDATETRPSYGSRLIGTKDRYFFGTDAQLSSGDGTGGGGDAGIVAINNPIVTNPSFDTLFDSAIARWASASEGTSKKELYPITAAASASGGDKRTGNEVCLSAAPIVTNDSQQSAPRAQFICGRQIATNVKATYTEKALDDLKVHLRGLTRVDWCPQGRRTTGVIGGTSGGPIFVGHTAYGLQSGKRDENGCIGTYEPIADAASALGVTIQTG